MLAIATYATKSYCYAQEAQAPLVVASLRYAHVDPADCMFIFVGDKSGEAKEAFEHHDRRLKRMGVPDGRRVRVQLDVPCGGNAQHKKESNLVIARLQLAAFDEARVAGADLFWSLEADVLPQTNALRTLMDTLAWDRGFYDVAMATYPNDAFLGGHGTPRNWILPNTFPDEREIPDDLRQWLDYRARRQQRLGAAQHMVSDRTDAKVSWLNGVPAWRPEDREKPDSRLQQELAIDGTWPVSPEEREAWAALDKAVEECPPKGNVWQRNSENWRLRGWLDDAHPGMGLGGMINSEWVGVGCTLFSERALNLANFVGYDGGCTQDLWLCWRAWHPRGLRISTVTHAICSHVKMREVEEEQAVEVKDAKGKVRGKMKQPVMVKKPFIHHAHHQLDGERAGHLNNHTKPWDGL